MLLPQFEGEREVIMPYEIRQRKHKTKPWCVWNTEKNELKGCTETKHKAIAFMRKLYMISKGK